MAAVIAVVGAGCTPGKVANRQTPAFPGAMGFGAHAEGGRGGDVAIVTNLADSGPGSLRHAIDTAVGPRTIVFEVGGTIDLQRPLRIRASHLTIAGQSAPGGLTLRGYPVEVVDSDHVVLRYLRFRPGDRNAAAVPGKPGRGNADLLGDAADALTVIQSEHVIIDHVSASWSMDETLSVTKSANVTVQNSIIGESLNDSFHTEGTHGFGSLVRGTGERGYSFSRNLWAHHQRRMPAIGGQQDDPPPGERGQGLDVDIVNNVMYDWILIATSTLNDPYDLRVNLQGNTYIAGPSLAGCPCSVFNIEATAEEFQVFDNGNAVDNDRDGTFNPRPMVASDSFGAVSRVDAAFHFDRPPLRVRSADRAYREVLRAAGASNYRDAVDARIVHQVRNQTGGVIDSQDDVGGWVDTPAAHDPPHDHDRDGMADRWERRNGLDPTDPGDAARRDRHQRYTNLERYLETLT